MDPPTFEMPEDEDGPCLGLHVRGRRAAEEEGVAVVGPLGRVVALGVVVARRERGPEVGGGVGGRAALAEEEGGAAVEAEGLAAARGEEDNDR
eukprot:3889371-Pyramimonas_sp.AAC.1